MKIRFIIVLLVFTCVFGSVVLSYLEQLAATSTDGEVAVYSFGSAALFVPLVVLMIGLGMKWTKG